MSAVVNLLLLLSALLSALTGVGGARVQHIPTVAGASLVAQTAVTAARRVGTRPVQALPSRRDVAVFAWIRAAVPAAEPLFANRRRE